MSKVVHLVEPGFSHRVPELSNNEEIVELSTDAFLCPMFKADVIFCYIRLRWNNMTLLSSIRAEHPGAIIVNALDEEAAQPIAAYVLSGLFDSYGSETRPQHLAQANDFRIARTVCV